MLNNMLGEEDLADGRLGALARGHAHVVDDGADHHLAEADGTVTALGTGGSNRIRTAILQVAVNLLDHGMSLDAAVEAPRLHVDRDGTVSFEPGLPERRKPSCARSKTKLMPGRRRICSSAASMPRGGIPRAASRAPAIRARKAWR